jgi:ketosteroid isomerase-like protein
VPGAATIEPTLPGRLTVRTLQELSDLEDVRQLRLDYSYHFDSGNLEALLDLYTDDAVCDFANFGLWTGKDEIRRGWEPYVIRTDAPFTRGRHAMSTPKVVIDGDTATSEWFLFDMVFVDGKGNMRENPMALLGMYEDHCVRVGGVWKIAKTKLHFYWPQRGGGPAELTRAAAGERSD